VIQSKEKTCRLSEAVNSIGFCVAWRGLMGRKTEDVYLLVCPGCIDNIGVRILMNYPINFLGLLIRITVLQCSKIQC